MIGIIDYGVGNLFSLKSSFEAIGEEVFVSGNKEELQKAEGLILPGVGAFEDAKGLWQSYNGRFFGNMLVDMMNYSKIFRVILQTIVITGIIYFSSKFSSKKNEKTNVERLVLGKINDIIGN